MDEKVNGIFEKVIGLIGEEDVRILGNYFGDKAVEEYRQSQENAPDIDEPQEEKIEVKTEDKPSEEKSDESGIANLQKSKPEIKNIINEQIVIEKPQKNNFFVKQARKKANKETQKAKTAVETVHKQIETAKKEIETVKQKRDEALSKHASISGEIIGLQNANSFIDMNIQSGASGIILDLAKKSNIRKINSLDKQRENIYNNIDKMSERLQEIEKNIQFLQNECLSERQSDLASAELKAENISLISKFANPLAALMINKKTPEAIAELEKYMFMKIDKEKLNNLGGYEYDVRVSKKDDTIYIIRFLRIQKDDFMKAMAEEA